MITVDKIGQIRRAFFERHLPIKEIVRTLSVSRATVRVAIPDSAAGKPVEFWWQDEARVGQQGTLTRVWARRGSRPRALRDHGFTSAYLFGAACPARGVRAAIMMPEVNVDAMNTHFAEISRNVSVGAIALLILDGAGWHSAPRLKIPENIVLLRLPPYAPELTRWRISGNTSEAISSATSSIRTMRLSSMDAVTHGTLSCGYPRSSPPLPIAPTHRSKYRAVGIIPE